MRFLFSIYLLAILSVSLCQTDYYVDAKIGDDSSNGSQENPFKTLTHAINCSKSTAATIYLRKAQIFSDITSKIEINFSLTLKCWTDETIPAPESYAKIWINSTDISFLVAADLTFHGIVFQYSASTSSSTFINMTSNAGLFLKNVEISNSSSHGIKGFISSVSNASIEIENTAFSGLEFKAGSFINFKDGTFFMKGVSVKNCTFNGSLAFVLNGSFSFNLLNSTFQLNTLYDTPLFLLTTETQNPLKIDTVNVTNNKGLSLQNVSMAAFLSLNSNLSSLTLLNSQIFNNSVAMGTSGLRVSGNKFEMSSCKFEQNGDLSLKSSVETGVLTVYSSFVTIDNSVFTSNGHFYGGAIFLQGNSNITISDSNFARNQANFGGSIYIQASFDVQLDIAITDSNFIENRAIKGPNHDSLGGAIYFENAWKLLLVRNIFEGNQASTKRGGFYFTGRYQSQFYSGRNSFRNNSQLDFAHLILKNGGGGAFIQDTNYIDDNNTYNGNKAFRAGALFFQNGNIFIHRTRFDENHADYLGGSLEARSANLTITNTSFFCCSTMWVTQVMIYLNTMKGVQIIDSIFDSNIDVIVFTGGDEEENAFSFTQCSFFGSVASQALIKSYNSPISIDKCDFTNSIGTLVEHMGPAAIELTNIVAVNTSCISNRRGCLLEATGSRNIRLDNLTVIDMTMPPDCSVITLNSVFSISFSNSAFHNILGSAGRVCLSALQVGIRIVNFTATNFSFGCISIKDARFVVVRNFIADNSENSKMIMNENSASGVSGSVLDLEAVRGTLNYLTSITIKGNRNILHSQGGAIRMINCEKFYLLNVLLQENEAEFGGGMFILKSSISIRESDFVKNKGSYGGGLYAEGVSNNGLVDISTTNFEHNIADLTGGGAHFEKINTTFRLTNVVFLNNSGGKSESRLLTDNSRGGAIYYSCADPPFYPEITNLSVRGSSADYGGGMYFNQCIFDPAFGNNFVNNSASKSGSTFASYPPVQILLGHEMKNDANTSIKFFFENGTSISPEDIIKDFFIYDWTNSTHWKRFTNSTTSLSHIKVEINYFNQSGRSSLQQPLSFYALDHFGQQIKADDQNFYLKVEPSTNNSRTSKNNCPVNSTNRAFFVGCKFSSYPGTNIILNVRTNLPAFLINSSNIFLNIAFKSCEIGEIIPYNTQICSMCPPNTYSITKALNSTVICKSCEDLTGSICRKGGSAVTVGPGHRRYNESSLNLIPCPNPAACTPTFPDTTNCSDIYSQLKPFKIQEACKNYESDKYSGKELYKRCSPETQKNIGSYCNLIINGTASGICNEERGYKALGVLCTECAEGWGKSKNYECVQCKPTFSFFASMTIIELFKIWLVYEAISKVLTDQFDQLGSALLKISITFFQIQNLLFSVPMYWPPFFDIIRRSLISFFSTGTNLGSYSYDCFLYWMNTNSSWLNYFTYNALYSFFAPIIWTIATAAILLIRKFALRSQIPAKKILKITFLVTYFYFWPDMITNAFSTLHPINIGPEGADEWRLLSDPTIVWNSLNHRILLFFGIPTLIISGFCLPFFLFLKILICKNRNSLDDERFLQTYGFIYRGYETDYYFWEFFILFRKMAMVCASVFLAQDLIYMCITLSFIIVLSTGLQLYFRPFRDAILQRMELIALLCLVAINYGSLYHLHLESTISTIFFVSLTTLATVFFLLPWLMAFQRILREMIVSCWQSIKTYSLICFNCLKLIVVSCFKFIWSCLKRVWRTQFDDHRNENARPQEVGQEVGQRSGTSSLRRYNQLKKF